MHRWLSGFALFAYGFRPFFLLAGVYAVLALAVWLAALGGTHGLLPPGIPPHYWHGHEMLFGFVAAAIAGFLLTAVPSWTGGRGYSGGPLVLMTVAWLAGRIAMLFAGTPHPSGVALADLIFFPALALLIAPSLLRSKSRNLVFLLVLALLFTANLLFHLGLMRPDPLLAGRGLLLGIDLVLLMVVIIGGRIVPAFTLSAVRRVDERAAIVPFPALDRAAIAAVVLVLLVDVWRPGSTAAGAVALIAGVLHGLRLARWKTLPALRIPLVWILHAGYSWVVVGLALKGIFLLSGAPFASAWLHALTAGAFASMILGVMTRASLGHTGRPLVAPPLITVSYVLITLAAAVRVAGPVLPLPYLHGLAVSGALWLGAFLLYLYVYVPILVSPRVDGKPG